MGDDRTAKPEAVEHLELHGTESQVGAQRSARQGHSNVGRVFHSICLVSLLVVR